jgi:chaperonin GroEL (HSP60 family)
MMPLLEAVIVSGKPLLIVAEDVDGELLPSLIMNNRCGTLQVVAIRAPAGREKREVILDQVADFTGATVFSSVLGRKLENVTLGWLGIAERVVVEKDRTRIYGGFGKDLRDFDGVGITATGAVAQPAVETDWEPASDRTGAPGRPTSSHLVEQRFSKRITAGIVLPSISEEAQWLSDWLKRTRPSFAPMTPTTVENRIRTEYNKYKASKIS